MIHEIPIQIRRQIEDDYNVNVRQYDLLKHYWNYAARTGNLQVIKILCTNNSSGFTRDSMDLSATNGHLKVVKFLCQAKPRNAYIDNYAIDYAASNNHLDVVKWLHQNTLGKFSKRGIEMAAENGHLRVVKFLHENRHEKCTEDYAMSYASMNGHLNIVKYLSSYNLYNSQKYVDDAVNTAIEHRRPDIAKFLRD